MADKENLSEFYFKDLHKTNKPVPLLTHFVCEVLGKTASRGDYVKIGRLIKMYGRESVFFSILDMYDIDMNTDDYYPLLVYLAKRRLESKNRVTTQPELKDLSSEVKALEKLIKKFKKENKAET